MTAAAKKVQLIQPLDGEPEYVPVPYRVYRVLKGNIDAALKAAPEGDSRSLRLDEYVDNTVVRIKELLSQEELARRMNVTQDSISNFERQEKVTAKVLSKVQTAPKARR